MTKKPQYKIPTMQEINKIQPNGLNVISTFSGAGGSTLGYKLAGFNVLWANEFVEAAQDTYKANFVTSILDTRDIRKITGNDILQAVNMNVGDIDILDGSPPCASFSTLGKRDSKWGDVNSYSSTKQRTDDLFWEFIRLLNEIQPKTFVAENVKGLVTGTAKGHFLEILEGLKQAGYNVTAKLLNAKWLGVPQKRERLIFVGVRQDLNKTTNTHPEPLPYYYTFQDAVKNVDNKDMHKQVWLNDNTNALKYWQYVAQYNLTRFCHAVEALENKPNSWYAHIRCNNNDATNTITQGGTMYHPTEPRRLSIAELKRLASFPDDFKLTGTYNQQWERICRAVPPLMMHKISSTIRDNILCRI